MVEKNKFWENLEEMEIGSTRTNSPTNKSAERLTRTPFGYVYTYGDMQGTSSVLLESKESNTKEQIIRLLEIEIELLNGIYHDQAITKPYEDIIQLIQEKIK